MVAVNYKLKQLLLLHATYYSNYSNHTFKHIFEIASLEKKVFIMLNTTILNSSRNSFYDENNVLTCLFEKIDLHEHNRTNSQILGILVAILTVCTVVPNGLVVAAMLTTKQYRRSPSHVLLLVLAICDLMIGVISMPTYVAHRLMIANYSAYYEDALCHISKFVKLTAYSFASFTILTIALITIELYLAIVRPFIYEHRYNKQYFIVYLMLAWTLFIVANAMSLYAFPADWVLFKSFVVSWLCIVVFILIIIFHSLLSVEVGKLNRSTTTNPCFSTTSNIVMPMPTAPSNIITPATTGSTNNINSNANKNRLNRKAFRMTTSIITAFSFCYLPLSVVMLYQVFKKTTASPSSSKSDRLVRMYVLPWCEFIALCNSALDPVIYCFRLRFIRHKIRRMLCPARFQKVIDINMAVRKIRSGHGGVTGGVEWASNVTPKYNPNTKVNHLNHLFQRQAQSG